MRARDSITRVLACRTPPGMAPAALDAREFSADRGVLHPHIERLHQTASGFFRRAVALTSTLLNPPRGPAGRGGTT